MYKILFINPPLHNFLGGCHSETTPLGLMYLAAVLKKNNYQAKIIDAEALLLSWSDLAEKIKRENPAIIGIGCTSLSLPALIKTAEISRQVCPHAKIITGGPGVTFEAQRILKENNFIDLVVMHEAEETILEIMAWLTDKKSLTEIKGLAWRKNNQIIINPPREFINDLDSIPLPAYDLLNPKLTDYSGMHRGYQSYDMPMPNAVIMASRGCPHRCIFCSNSKIRNRRRNPKKIVDEIEYCQKLGAKSIQFYDDEFIGTHRAQNKWIIEICDEIIKRKLTHLSYLVQGRCSPFVELEVLQKMRTAGFNWIWWGVESGSQKVLDLMKKDTNLDEIRRCFKLSKQAGLNSLMFLVIGIPGEEEKDVYQTAKLVEEIKPERVRFHIITPFPGSELWQTLKEKNQIDEYDFINYDTRFKAVHHTDQMSQQKIEELYKMLVLRYESDKRNWLRIFKNSFLSIKEFKLLPGRIIKILKLTPRWLKVKFVKI